MSLFLGLAMGLAPAPGEAEIGYDRYLQPVELVEIAPDRRIHLRCEGSGGPTILLEAGLGFPSLSWRDVQPALARLARTCAYDRAGLGFSDPGPLPRSAGAIVDDLELLIDRAGLEPPFVLVGNSMGGQVLRLLAFRHPEQIAGLVLLDPYVEGQYAALAAIDPSIGEELEQVIADEAACVERLRQGRLTPEQAESQGCISGPATGFSPELIALLRRQRMQPAWFEASHSESLMLDTENEQQLRAAQRHLGDIPLIVLSASRNYESARFAQTRPALLAEQERLLASLAALSNCGELRPVDSGHVIQTGAPSAVVDAVRDILEGNCR